MKQKLLLFVFCVFVSLSLQAQSKLVTGKVSASNGETLPGVTVLVKGTTVGTATDAEGNYKINVPDNGKFLVFSFVGFKMKEEEIGDRSIINVSMEADVINLGEVVVTANAIVREKKELGYAVSTVGGGVLQGYVSPNNLVRWVALRA
ncbi:MAG: carboxypeptidase-like regulatory domain-containing protein [Thermoflexibacter sp.]|nr:carboxypeptidase-like regulatory domain-containing protein [Thermoflexibacter sp.]